MSSTGQGVSYAEYEARTNRLAHLLRAPGLGRLAVSGWPAVGGPAEGGEHGLIEGVDLVRPVEADVGHPPFDCDGYPLRLCHG